MKKGRGGESKKENEEESDKEDKGRGEWSKK